MSKKINKSTENDSNHESLQELEQVIKTTNPTVFEGINPQKKKEILRSITLIQAKSHSGPLPAPETLIEYNAVITNGA